MYIILFVGDEAANCNHWNMDCTEVLRTITLHISSPILAAKSPFFYKVSLTKVFFHYLLCNF